ncbi:MAG: protein kinase [Alistipes sp.]|nr:protein kinase [Alistipes sp.]
MTSIANIVDAIRNPFCVWRTLRGVEPVLSNGEPRYVVGNAAVTFFVRHNQEPKILKCYTRTHKNLYAIYGRDFHERELCVADLTGRKLWVDCLLMPLIEGQTLDNLLRQNISSQTMVTVAAAFDNMARELLSSQRAHGDLKPENIIVSPDHLTATAIDWDAAYLPQFAGEKSNEIGTAAYQHPARTMEMFDKHIDDYSIATISTLLHAASIDTGITEHYRTHFEPPFSPKQILRGDTATLDSIIDSFARRVMAQQYHIAKMLTSPLPRLFRLQTILQHETNNLGPATEAELRNAQLDVCEGLWGYRSDSRWIIPPLYESAFEPSEGTMLVKLGRYKHFITLDSRLLATFDENTIVKPFHNGKTSIRQADGSTQTLYSEQILQNSAK